MTLREAKQTKPGTMVYHNHICVQLKNYCRAYKYDRDENYDKAVVKHKSGNLQTVNTIDLYLESHITRRKENEEKTQ